MQQMQVNNNNNDMPEFFLHLKHYFWWFSYRLLVHRFYSSTKKNTWILYVDIFMGTRYKMNFDIDLCLYSIWNKFIIQKKKKIANQLISKTKKNPFKLNFCIWNFSSLRSLFNADNSNDCFDPVSYMKWIHQLSYPLYWKNKNNNNNIIQKLYINWITIYYLFFQLENFYWHMEYIFVYICIMGLFKAAG